MIKTETLTNDFSKEDQKKVDFLKEVENIMQQIAQKQISASEGYNQLMKLLGEQETERALEMLYQLPH